MKNRTLIVAKVTIMNNRQLHIGFNIDGVLRNFGAQFLKYTEQVRGVEVEPEDFDDYGFPNVRDKSGRKVIVDVFANPAAGEFVYQNAPPIENAYTGYMMFVNNPKIGVYLIGSGKKEYEKFTHTWMEKNNFDKHDSTFFEDNKLKAPVQILVDHKPENVVRYNQNKRDSILINHRHNRNAQLPTAIARVDDMIEAYRYVTKRYAKYV